MPTPGAGCTAVRCVLSKIIHFSQNAQGPKLAGQYTLQGEIPWRNQHTPDDKSKTCPFDQSKTPLLVGEFFVPQDYIQPCEGLQYCRLCTWNNLRKVNQEGDMQ
jgi:hypothetical protein